MNARTPLTSMFLPGWNVYNQNRIVTSENALAPTFLTHTHDECICLRAGPREVLRCALVVVHGPAEQGEDALDVHRPALFLRVLSGVLSGSRGELAGLARAADLLQCLARLAESLLHLVVPLARQYRADTPRVAPRDGTPIISGQT